MPKITSVELQKKSAHRFNIYLDGQFAFGADEDLIVARRLVVGKTIEPVDLEKILFEVSVGKLMERMYRLFGIRQRSEREIRDYFKKLNIKNQISKREKISNLVIDATVEVLKKKGLINDLEFAKAWVDSRGQKRGWRVLQTELIKKGINREIIERIKEQESNSKGEENIAISLLEKRIVRWQKLPTLEKKKKAYEFLMRRGFEYEVIKYVIQCLLT